MCPVKSTQSEDTEKLMENHTSTNNKHIVIVIYIQLPQQASNFNTFLILQPTSVHPRAVDTAIS